MKYLVTQTEMKQYDKNTIEHFKVPSIVLMERAALVTVEHIKKQWGPHLAKCRVLVAAGCGNNGGDGFAIGRLLLAEGCRVDFVLLGERAKCSRETTLQLEILERYGHTPYDTIPSGEYDIVIDAIFGIGLTRKTEGIYKEAIEHINGMNAYVCAADIPSGVHADSGQIAGCAVRADLTVAYGFDKLGEWLYPGTLYCGKIICGQMGIDEHSFRNPELPDSGKPCWYTYDSLKDVILPYRRPDGNKGTFGKVLVIAGSDTVSGAAVLAARSVLRAGAGMVKVITSVKNREVAGITVPEAMMTVYDTERWRGGEPDDIFAEAFEKAHEWADCILIGPGIGTGKEALWFLRKCLFESSLPIVIDADGLNLIAADREACTQELSAHSERSVILTPHLGEFARLFGCGIKEVSGHLTDYPKMLADKLHCTVVCKDARTVIASYDSAENYLNTTGNAGMATAGSGDVLAGIITGLLAQGMEAREAAVSGVYLHGAAGDRAAALYGERSLTASDIIEEMAGLFREAEK